MKVTISKKFDFDCAHRLPKVPRGHKCRRMHGHTYAIEVICEGEVDKRGMVLDYAEIAAAWMRLHARIDHRTLNSIRGLENPTTEVLAPWLLRRLARMLPQLVAVKVYESSATWCEARL